MFIVCRFIVCIIRETLKCEEARVTHTFKYLLYPPINCVARERVHVTAEKKKKKNGLLLLE